MTDHKKLWTKGFTIVTISTFLLFLNMQMLLVSTPALLREHFQASDPTVGLVTSLFAGSAIVARMYAGRPSQIQKLGCLLLIGLCIALVGTVGIYWSYAIIGILIMRMVYGIGFGVASTALSTMASNMIPAHKMGEGMGYFGYSNTLGLMLGPMFGLFLFDSYGQGTLIAIASLMIAVVFPLMFIVLPKSTRSSVQQDQEKVELTQGKQKRFFSKKLLIPSVLNVLMYSTYSGLISFIVLFGQEQNIQGVGIFFLFSSLVVLLVRPFAGRSYDRKGIAAVVVPGAIFMIIGLLLLSGATSLSFVILSALVYGSGYGILQASIQAWMINRVSKEERGLANGMFFNSLDLGVVTGALMLGMIASAVGYVHMYHLSAVFMVLFLMIFWIFITFERRDQYVKGKHEAEGKS